MLDCIHSVRSPNLGEEKWLVTVTEMCLYSGDGRGNESDAKDKKSETARFASCPYFNDMPMRGAVVDVRSYLTMV